MRERSPLLLALAIKLKAERARQNLTQAALGERSGLCRTYVADIESGRRNLSFNNIAALAQALGLTLSQLTQDLELLSVKHR